MNDNISMNKLVFLLIFILFWELSAQNVIAQKTKKDKTFLYLYTESCGYCVKFNPIYDKLAKVFGDKIDFIKVDANKPDGYRLMKNYGAKFVPFVVIIDNKKDEGSIILPNCLLQYACSENQVKRFIN